MNDKGRRERKDLKEERPQELDIKDSGAAAPFLH